MSNTRQKRTFVRVKPVYIRKLVDALGHQGKAAEKIGVTDGCINRYLVEDNASQAAELAAQFIYERDHVKIAMKKETLAIVRVSSLEVDTIERVVEMAGGSFTVIGLEA